MLSKVATTRTANASRSLRRAASSSSWTVNDPALTQRLVDEISSQRTESVKTVVPWFMQNMPVNVPFNNRAL